MISDLHWVFELLPKEKGWEGLCPPNPLISCTVNHFYLTHVPDLDLTNSVCPPGNVFVVCLLWYRAMHLILSSNQPCKVAGIIFVLHLWEMHLLPGQAARWSFPAKSESFPF